MRVTGLSGAHGRTAAEGWIDHRHTDGLYAFDDAAVSCSVTYATPPGIRLPARIALRYLPQRRAFTVTLSSPVSEALTDLPQACPSQGDGIDGLYDNYFTPGFSFAGGYGPARWFSSRPAIVSIAALRRSTTMSIRVSGAPGGRPPTGCAVPEPAIERCETGGSWAGVLTFRARR
jgi:hypothetical protein